MTTRVRDFLRMRRESGRDGGPCLVVDLDLIRENYATFAKALPDTRIFLCGEGAVPAAGSLGIGDKVRRHKAYTAAYSAVAFIGFGPLLTVHT